MDNRKLNGRRVYLPQGRDQLEDRNILSDCIAGSGADLFAETDGNVVWVAGGRKISVNHEVLGEICQLVIVTKHLKEADGSYVVVYEPHVPDKMTLVALLNAKSRAEGSLARRLPLADSRPHGLNWQKVQEIRLRFRRGERADCLAEMFNAERETIEQIVR